MTDQKSARRKLRIAVLNRHFGPRFGGAERYAAAVVENLASQHEIHVYAQEIEHQAPGVTYHLISRPLAKPRWLNQLWFAFETWRLTRTGFNLVHSHENTWHGDIQTVHVRPFKVGLFRNTVGMRRILKWLALFTSPRLLAYWFLEAARFRSRSGLQVVATSSPLMSDLLAAYPHTRTCMHVISPGVALPPRPPDKADARLQLGLPTTAEVALFVGNDFAKKGLSTLLEAMALAPKLHLMVVGSGQQMASFQQLSQQFNILDRVHFMGSMPNITCAYEAADLLVHPTTEDTYAMVVLEAMSHGLPVIVSDARYCGIAAELTHERQALILADPFSAQGLAHEIERLRCNPLLREQLGQAGKKFAYERNWSSIGQLHENLFQKFST